MKLLSDSQKRFVYGGASITGIVNGVSALVWTSSLVISYASDYLAQYYRGFDDRKYNYKAGYDFSANRIFYNDYRSVSHIFS